MRWKPCVSLTPSWLWAQPPCPGPDHPTLDKRNDLIKVVWAASPDASSCQQPVGLGHWALSDLSTSKPYQSEKIVRSLHDSAIPLPLLGLR